MKLTDWDTRLLNKYLTRYKRLANGTSTPKSINEKSFVDFLKNNTKPKTQHEIAYSKYLESNKDDFNNLKIDKESESKNKIFEKNIDYLDQKILLNKTVKNDESKIVEKITSWYKRHVNNIPNIKLAESLAWLNQLSSESTLSKSLERLSAETFNTLSNAYTKALDGAFAEGLKAGEDYISPLIHRIDISGHTIIDAINKTRDALPNDTNWEEIKGLVTSLASDMSSVTGLPIAVLGKETRQSITDTLNNIGISESKFVDLWSQNTVELVGSVIPAIALLLSWNDKDTKNFAKIVGMLNLTAIYAGNPVGIIIGIVGLARSYQKVKKNEESTKTWVLAFSKGGAISATSIILMSVVGPIVWTTFTVCVVVIILMNKNNIKINWKYLGNYLKEIIRSNS
ncbi:DUF413 domain-containing protein [Alphaproteobacteria bacterium]|nr:DUF413 domain-containing protein [Alphaproteobacteria bacterium]